MAPTPQVPGSPRPVRRRRKWKRLALALVGACLGASCPYWPQDVVWVCVVVTKAAAVLHGG